MLTQFRQPGQQLPFSQSNPLMAGLSQAVRPGVVTHNQKGKITADMHTHSAPDLARGINFYADYSGCGHWRMIWPENLLNCYGKANIQGGTVMIGDKNFYKGNYYFTIDSCHPEPNILNTGYSELQQEHKSFNVIKLDNGQFAAQPNNRIRWFEQSLIPEETKIPDFNVCTKDYSVETGDKWSLGDNTEYFYKTKEEKEADNLDSKT